MKPLLAAMAVEGARLCAAAEAVGGRIEFEPQTTLARARPAALSCRLIAAADGWLAVNLPRDDDVAAVPAWIGCALEDEPWDVIARTARRMTTEALLAQAILLHLPVAVVGEAVALTCPPMPKQLTHKDKPAKIIDLSALWAGPYCGALLAEAGCDVTRVESITRPDPTFISDPLLDARLNGGKRRIAMDIRSPELLALIDTADILITSGRPHALARLGLTPAVLFARNPTLIWVAVTSHGWHGDAAMRVGFGDDCAAAGGLVTWRDGEPHLMGDALADPLTGMLAARRAMEAWAAGQAGLIDAALAPSAAHFAGMMAC